MEELVTVDEVGGEDDSIVEPDLSELEEFASCPKESGGEKSLEKHLSPSTSSVEVRGTSKETPEQERSSEETGHQAATSVTEKAEDEKTTSSPENQKTNAGTAELPVANLSDFPSEEFKAALEETCLEDSKVPDKEPPEEPVENHHVLPEDSKMHEEAQVTEVINNGVQQRDDNAKKGTFVRGGLTFSDETSHT